MSKNTSEDLINLHFNSNRLRQGLTEDGEKDDDRSRKGSVDEKIIQLVQSINSHEDFFTTSTCSGRTILFSNESESKNHEKIKKKGCNWIFVSHDEVNFDDFLKAWNTTVKMGEKTYLKMEPSIFHIQSRTLKRAKKLLHVGTEAGFRNSGMVIGKDNKITVAIRSAIGMEVPLTKTQNQDEIFTNAFLEELINEANLKLADTWSRSEKFHQNFIKEFH